MSAIPQPFFIDVAQETCDWLTERVKTARLVPDRQHPAGKEWEDGTPTSTMQDLVDYWRTDYDWRKVEKRLNDTFKMFTVDLEESAETVNLHFVHHRSARKDAIPLLFAHGWPGSFLEVENLLQLVDPKDPNAQAYHVVAPSIPGFTFSSSPKAACFSTAAKIGSLYHKLMQTLGYHHYICQGGDWGAFLLRAMANSFPEHCVGIHLNFVFALPPSPFKNPVALLWLALRSITFTTDQKARLERMLWWMKDESGYSQIHGQKPQTISYALQDSPIGMLAWIREKLEVLVEPDYVWDKEVVITWTTLYLLSGSAGSARIYKDAMTSITTEVGAKIPKQVSFGASLFPRDVAYATKWWAQASVAENIVFWKEHQRGGHFASVECCDVLIQDIQEFVQNIQADRKKLLLDAGA